MMVTKEKDISVMHKMIHSLEDENNKSVWRGGRNSSAYTDLAFFVCPVSTSLRASGVSEVEPEPHQTKTRGDVIFIG